MSLRPERSCYLQGIRRAEQDGLIAYACSAYDKSVRGARLSDEYSHICSGDGEPLSLKHTNTRPLSFVARQLLNLYRDDPDVRFLELGPGAGVACAAVNRLLPGATIDTVSLTPLNPYLRFRRDDLHECITESGLQEHALSNFFDACSRPFVRNQYIGQFPSGISLPKESYHFIYENYGAIFYNFHPNGNSEPMELSRASISSALSLLRRDGTMLIMASDGSYRMEDALESATIDTDVIVTCKKTTAYHIFPCIVAREESPLSRRLREDKSGLLSKSERALRLDFQAWESIISKICVSRN
jgi:hypothetical protein